MNRHYFYHIELTNVFDGEDVILKIVAQPTTVVWTSITSLTGGANR